VAMSATVETAASAILFTVCLSVLTVVF